MKTDLATESGYTICCPSCRSEYLHQESVDVYFRTEDDLDDGIAVIPSITSSERLIKRPRYKTNTDTNVEFNARQPNPSPRRDGLVITFSCEACTASPKLRVYQHKGRTFVGWQDEGYHRGAKVWFNTDINLSDADPIRSQYGYGKSTHPRKHPIPYTRNILRDESGEEILDESGNIQYTKSY